MALNNSDLNVLSKLIAVSPSIYIQCKIYVEIIAYKTHLNPLLGGLGFYNSIMNGINIISIYIYQKKGAVVICDRMVHCSWIYNYPMQSVPITTNFLSLNPAHGEGHSIQHHVIKFVSEFWQVGGFLRVLRFHPLIKQTDKI